MTWVESLRAQARLARPPDAPVGGGRWERGRLGGFRARGSKHAFESDRTRLPARGFRCLLIHKREHMRTVCLERDDFPYANGAPETPVLQCSPWSRRSHGQMGSSAPESLSVP